MCVFLGQFKDTVYVIGLLFIFPYCSLTKYLLQRRCLNLDAMPPVKQKAWEAHAGPLEKKLEIGHRPLWHTAARRQICFAADLSESRTAPGSALPKERRIETTTRRRVSRRRLMLHIKQTKEIANLIVWHSLAQPNITKSDSLSLSQSKTWYNQIPPTLFHDLIWQGLAESFHIVKISTCC